MMVGFLDQTVSFGGSVDDTPEAVDNNYGM